MRQLSLVSRKYPAVCATCANDHAHERNYLHSKKILHNADNSEINKAKMTAALHFSDV